MNSGMEIHAIGYLLYFVFNLQSAHKMWGRKVKH